MNGSRQYAEAVTIGDLLLRAGDENPERIALVVGSQQTSYRQLVESSIRFARSLMALDVEPGDRVGLLMPNCFDFVVAFFGSALAGAVLVPMNIRCKSEELHYLMANSGMRVLITTDLIRDHADLCALTRDALRHALEIEDRANPHDAPLRIGNAPELRWMVNLGEQPEEGFLAKDAFYGRTVSREELDQRRSTVRLRDLAALIYTSGTTSEPKGCMLTHEALVRNWTAAGQRLGVRSGDRCWDPLPLFHGTGYGPLLLALGAGATFITDVYFDADQALELIEATKPTFLYPGFPAVTSDLIDHPRFPQVDFSDVRALLAIAPADFWYRSQAAFPDAVQLSGYGLAEAGGIVSYTPIDEAEELRALTCGPPLFGIGVEVADPNSGRLLTPGSTGEILVKGVTLFEGYWKDPQKTSDVLDERGFLHTGDMGRIDEKGSLVFIGRIKDMLKVGGENVAAAEIESCLLGHPAVKEAKVVGMPDDRLGEVPAAFVETRPGSSATEGELIAHCADRIASFKVPRLVRFLDEWPMSATKVQKHKLRERLLDELAGMPQPHQSQSR